MLPDHLLHCLYRSLMHWHYVVFSLNNFSGAPGLLLASIHNRSIFWVSAVAGFTALWQSEAAEEGFVLSGTQCRAVCPAEPGTRREECLQCTGAASTGVWAAQAHCHCQHSPVPTSLWSPAAQSAKTRDSCLSLFVALIVTNVWSTDTYFGVFCCRDKLSSCLYREALICNTFQMENMYLYLL